LPGGRLLPAGEQRGLRQRAGRLYGPPDQL